MSPVDPVVLGGIVVLIIGAITNSITAVINALKIKSIDEKLAGVVRQAEVISSAVNGSATATAAQIKALEAKISSLQELRVVEAKAAANPANGR